MGSEKPTAVEKWYGFRRRSIFSTEGSCGHCSFRKYIGAHLEGLFASVCGSCAQTQRIAAGLGGGPPEKEELGLRRSFAQPSMQNLQGHF